MGKRHQASRRKSYGRRQHEVRERIDRQRPEEVGDTGIHGPDPVDRVLLFGLGFGDRRLGFALRD